MTTFPPYEYKESAPTEEGIKYFFISRGKTDVVKAVHYMYSANMNDLKIYNLGFGDYHLENDEIDDKANTLNGDVYKVSTGSDSNHDFYDNCKPNCTKKCTDSCKNQHRRINAYSSFVNKNYDELVKEYKFFGGIETNKGVAIEDFVRKKRYDAVLIINNFTPWKLKRQEQKWLQ